MNHVCYESSMFVCWHKSCYRYILKNKKCDVVKGCRFLFQMFEIDSDDLQYDNACAAMVSVGLTLPLLGGRRTDSRI